MLLTPARRSVTIAVQGGLLGGRGPVGDGQ